MTSQTDDHRVVVIGSGFGGLFGTKALRRSPVQVTMVAKTTHHLFQPLLYQVATGILSEGEIAPPTREILNGQANAQVLLGEVTAIDLDRRLVTSEVLGRSTVTPYDSLIVAAGAGQSYFGNDQFAEHAPGHEDRSTTRSSCAAGSSAPSRWPRSAPTAATTSTTCSPSWSSAPDRPGSRWPARSPSSRTARSSATSARSTPARPGSSWSTPPARCCRRSAPSSAPAPERELEKLGVEVMLGAMVTDVDERGIEVRHKDGSTERIAAVTKIWAAGVQASPLGADPVGADRRPARPGRPDRGQPRPHAARAPRGLRRRRHDRPRPPPRRRAGRDPGREVRREGDRRAAAREGTAEGVPLLRQGLDGHDLPVPRRGDDRPAAAHRLRGLADVARRCTSST